MQASQEAVAKTYEAKRSKNHLVVRKGGGVEDGEKENSDQKKPHFKVKQASSKMHAANYHSQTNCEQFAQMRDSLKSNQENVEQRVMVSQSKVNLSINYKKNQSAKAKNNLTVQEELPEHRPQKSVKYSALEDPTTQQ